jgi:cytochrome c oxidase subunit 2
MLGFVALAVSGCSGPLSALDPAGSSGQAIDTLWRGLLALSLALFAITMALLVLAWRGWRRLAALGENVWLIAGGLALPAVVLLPLAAYGLVVGERVFARPGAPDLTVDAMASRWTWEFGYPEAGGIRTQGTLHVPAGAKVDIRLTSLDVIHSFWVPRLGGKMDAIPGHANVLRISADKPGFYRGICSEYCGIGHAGMDFIVEAHAPEDYAQALRRAAGAQP